MRERVSSSPRISRMIGNGQSSGHRPVSRHPGNAGSLCLLPRVRDVLSAARSDCRAPAASRRSVVVRKARVRRRGQRIDSTKTEVLGDKVRGFHTSEGRDHGRRTARELQRALCVTLQTFTQCADDLRRQANLSPWRPTGWQSRERPGTGRRQAQATHVRRPSAKPSSTPPAWWD